jgi:YVTN family beta-propeller protein
VRRPVLQSIGFSALLLGADEAEYVRWYPRTVKKSTRFAATLAAVVLSASSFIAPGAGAAQLAAPDGILVGEVPLEVEYSSNGKLAFVTNAHSNNVSVINTKTLTVVNTIEVGDSPQSIHRSKNNRLMYVTNREDSTVSVIDIKHQVVVSTWAMASGTETCRLNPKGNLLACVTAAAPYQFIVYRSSNGSFIRSTLLPGDPSGVNFSKNGKTAYISIPDELVVVPVSLVNGVAETSIELDYPGAWPALSTDKSKLYMPHFDDDVVSIVSLKTNTVVASVTMPEGCMPSAAVARPRGKFMYVTCFGTGTVEAINIMTNTIDVSKRVMTEAGLAGISVNPAGTQALVTNPMTGEVWVLKGLK